MDVGTRLKPFEIHLTGLDESIHENAKKHSLKTISVDLLKPNLSVLRTEHMTSHVSKFEDFESCKLFVDFLVYELEAAGSKIVRTKIETPFYKEYAAQSLYIESHWNLDWTLDKTIPDEIYPLSRSQHHPERLLATARQYAKGKVEDQFDNFNDNWKDKAIVELCLYDSWIDEDFDWFSIWHKK